MPSRRSVAVIAVFAFVVRLAYVLVQTRFHVLQVEFDSEDSVLYKGIADSLLDGAGYSFNGRATAYVTPGYPLFLAGIYVFTRSTLVVGVAQSALGAATVVLLMWAAGAVGGRRAALATGGIAALYPHLIFWTGHVLTETLYTFGVAAAMALTGWCVDTATDRNPQGEGLPGVHRRLMWAALGTGAVYGLTGLVRPILLGFGVVVVVAAVFVRRYRRPALIAGASMCLVISPWIFRNIVVLGTANLSTESGVVLYQGNSPGISPISTGYWDGRDFEPLAGLDGLGEVEVERRYRSAALDWMSSNPSSVLGLVPKKTWNMWRPNFADASKANRVVTAITYLPMLGLACLGLVLAWRRHPLGVLMSLFVAYHLLVHGLITGMIRFRVPVEAVLTIAAGVAVAWLHRAWETRRIPVADTQQ